MRIDTGVQDTTNFVSIVTHSSHRSLRLIGSARLRNGCRESNVRASSLGLCISVR